MIFNRACFDIRHRHRHRSHAVGRRISVAAALLPLPPHRHTQFDNDTRHRMSRHHRNTNKRGSHPRPDEGIEVILSLLHDIVMSVVTAVGVALFITLGPR